MTTPISDIRNPAEHLVPFPCGDTAEDRNWLELINIINEVYNYVKRIGTLMASCVADDDGCNGQDVPIREFLLWGEDDPDNPITAPTTAYNLLTIEIKLDDILIIAYDPNSAQWKIVNVEHKQLSALTSISLQGASLGFSSTSFSAPSCAEEGTGGIDLATARVLTDIATNTVDGVCVVQSLATDLLVFAAAPVVAPTTEITFVERLVLTDIVLLGDVYGLYEYLWVPCYEDAGAAIVILVDYCNESGSGG
jgi:hypothetical protein